MSSKQPDMDSDVVYGNDVDIVFGSDLKDIELVCRRNVFKLQIVERKTKGVFTVRTTHIGSGFDAESQVYEVWANTNPNPAFQLEWYYHIHGHFVPLDNDSALCEMLMVLREKVKSHVFRVVPEATAVVVNPDGEWNVF